MPAPFFVSALSVRLPLSALKNAATANPFKLKGLVFGVGGVESAVAALVLQGFLPFAFLLVLFLASDAQAGEGQDLEASQLDLSFATLA